MTLLTKLFDLKSLSIFLLALILSIECFAQGPLAVNAVATPPEICHGESAQLFALASGGSGDYSYSWTSTPAGFSSTIPNPVINPSGTTTYHVTVNDGISEASGSVTVTVYDNPVPNAGSDQAIPFGTSTVLQGSAISGSGNYSYSWEPADKLINPNVAQPTTVNLNSTTLFTFYVTDAVTGCNAEPPDQVVVLITGDALAVNPIANPDQICQGETAQLYAIASGGTGEYTYSWTSTPPGFSSDLSNPVVLPMFTTTYSVSVSDGYNSISGSVIVSVHGSPELFHLSGGGLICQGGEGMEIHLNGSETECNYELYLNSVSTGVIKTGTGFPLNFGLQEEAGIYTVVATKVTNGCSTEMENTAVISYFVYGQADEICLVSVDSVTGKNIIAWEKTPDEAIASYNIYRESTSGGSFELMGNIGHENAGIYTDNASNPLQRSFSYGLSTLDTCNNESAMSEIHTTIHLNINTGINSYNLIWTPYYGFGYQTYYIHRRQAADGFHILDSLPNSILSYTDLNPPSGILDYVIEIRNVNDCNEPRENRSTRSVFSNIMSTNVGVEDPEGNPGLIAVFPNPNHGQFSLQTDHEIRNVCILDLTGKLMDGYSKVKISEREYNFDLSRSNPGMYLIKATLENGLVLNRFVMVY